MPVSLHLTMLTDETDSKQLKGDLQIPYIKMRKIWRETLVTYCETYVTNHKNHKFHITCIYTVTMPQH